MIFSGLNENLNFSKFCYGCEPLGGADWGDDFSVADIEKAVEVALDNGINFFDTADVYGLGLSEERLSAILAEKRHDLIIATKGGVSWQQKKNSGRATIHIDTSSSYIRMAVENSLRRLRLERIPVYYVHWPEKNRDVGEVANALYKLQQEGKICSIGCSNFSDQQLKRALEFAPINMLQIPVNILMDKPSNDITDICSNNNIAIIAYNVLASGLLTGKFNLDTVFPISDRRSRLPQFIGDGLIRSLKKVNSFKGEAIKNNFTLAQYSIKKVLEMPAVEASIIGIKHLKQLKENIIPFD